MKKMMHRKFMTSVVALALVVTMVLSVGGQGFEMHAKEAGPVGMSEGKPSPATLATLESLLRAINTNDVSWLDLSHVSDVVLLKTSLKTMFRNPHILDRQPYEFEKSQFDQLSITPLKRGVTLYSYRWSYWVKVMKDGQPTSVRYVSEGDFYVSETGPEPLVIDWFGGDDFTGQRFAALDMDWDAPKAETPKPRTVSAKDVHVIKIVPSKTHVMGPADDAVLQQTLAFLVLFETRAATIPKTLLRAIGSAGVLATTDITTFFPLYAALRHATADGDESKVGSDAPRLIRSELKSISVIDLESDYIRYDGVWSFSLLDEGVITSHERPFQLLAVRQAPDRIAMSLLYPYDVEYLRCQFSPNHLTRALKAHGIDPQLIVPQEDGREASTGEADGVSSVSETTDPSVVGTTRP